LTSIPGPLVLIASDARVRQAPIERVTGAWWQVLALSVAWGIAQAWLWGASWKTLGEYSGMLLMPTAVGIIVTFGGFYRQATVATADLLFGRSQRGLAISILVMVWGLIFLTLHGLGEDWPVGYPDWIRWTRPMAVFRPLVLAPVWGAWAMMAACLFHRRTYTTQPIAAAFAQGCGVLRTALVLALVTAGSLWYFDFLGPLQAVVPIASAVAAVVGGLGLSRRGRRLTRSTLLATNLLTQTVFYVAVLACR